MRQVVLQKPSVTAHPRHLKQPQAQSEQHTFHSTYDTYLPVAPRNFEIQLKNPNPHEAFLPNEQEVYPNLRLNPKPETRNPKPKALNRNP